MTAKTAAAISSSSVNESRDWRGLVSRLDRQPEGLRAPVEHLAVRKANSVWTAVGKHTGLRLVSPRDEGRRRTAGSYSRRSYFPSISVGRGGNASIGDMLMPSIVDFDADAPTGTTPR
jgi:hypothetical protein